MNDPPRPLVWDQLRSHIQPAEVDSYARRIGLSRISRNEDAYQERETLLKMYNAIQSDINVEVEKKNPAFLDTFQRKTAIDRAIKFLDNLKQQGHFVDPDNSTDSDMIKYLKFAKMNRPNSHEKMPQQKKAQLSSSARRSLDVNESISEAQALMDEEFNQITKDINEIRIKLFSSCDELDDVKTLELPSTESIEKFNKKLQTKEVVVRQMNKSGRTSSSVARLRDSVHLNRIWE